MLKVEFHCHTSASPDCLVRPEDLVRVCRARGIDRVVITDHNRISGALKAKEIDPELVIIGEEIRTTKGEFLAAFVSEAVPKRLSPEETLERLRAQRAFVSVSHPFDPLRSGWALRDLEALAPQVDAIETYNARNLRARYNQRAVEFAHQHGLPGTAGSDAHTLFELGRATMLLPDFDDAEGLRAAMTEVQYEYRSSGVLARFGSRWASLVKKLGIGTGKLE